MEVQTISPTDFCMEVVSEESASIFSLFSCGNEGIDEYFRCMAAHDPQNVCYVYMNKANGDIVGAAAVCCSGINVGNENAVQLIPAVKVEYFAVAEKYHRVKFPGTDDDEIFHISDAFLCELICEIRRIAAEYVGAQFLILYSVPSAVKFYKRNALEEFEKFMRPEQQRMHTDCIPMYMQFG